MMSDPSLALYTRPSLRDPPRLVTPFRGGSASGCRSAGHGGATPTPPATRGHVGLATAGIQQPIREVSSSDGCFLTGGSLHRLQTTKATAGFGRSWLVTCAVPPANLACSLAPDPSARVIADAPVEFMHATSLWLSPSRGFHCHGHFIGDLQEGVRIHTRHIHKRGSPPALLQPDCRCLL